MGSKKFKTPASSERPCRQQGGGVAFTLSGSKTDSCQLKIAQLEQPGSLDSGVGINNPNNKHTGVN